MQHSTFLFYSIGYLVGLISVLVMAVIVVWCQPRREDARLWAILSGLVAIWFLGRFTILHATTSEEAFFWQRVMYMGAIPLNVVYYHFVCAFLEKKKPLWFLYLGYLLSAGLMATNLSGHLFVRTMIEGTVFHFYERLGPFYPLHLAAYAIYPGFGIVKLAMARKTSSGQKRNQIDYVFSASLIGFLCATTTFPLLFGIKFPPVGGPFVPLYAFIVVYAIVKHHLLDIRVVIRRTLLYSIVTAGLASLYVGAVTLVASRLEHIGSTPAVYGRDAFHWIAENLRYSFSYSCIATAIFSLGFSIFVWVKSPKTTVARLWTLTCLSVGLWSLGLGMVTRATSAASAYAWECYVLYVASILIPIVFFHFVVAILRYKPRLMLWTGYSMAAIFLILNFCGKIVSVRIQPPFSYYTQAGQFYLEFTAYFFLLVVYAHILLFRAMSKGDARLKNQIKYIFLGTSIGFCGGSTTFFYVFNIPIFPYGDYAVPLYIVMGSYAIFKHHLLDINIVIKKTLIYSLISTALAAIYVGTITLLAYILQERHGAVSAYSSALAAVFITLLFNPLRTRIQKLIDKLFERSRLDIEGKMAEFSSKIVGEQDSEKVTQALFTALKDGINPAELAFYEKHPRDIRYEKMASINPEWPSLSDETIQSIAQEIRQSQPFIVNGGNGGWREEVSRAGIVVIVPLLSRGEWIGCLLLGEKKSDELYSEEDLTLLGIMANQSAVIYERPRLIREVSGGFVHEVKMPLSKISLPAELTYMEIEKARQSGVTEELLDKIQSRMKYIMEQTVVASQRVDALRELSAKEENPQQEVAVSRLIQKCLDSLEDSIQRTKVRIEHDGAKNIPTISGDPEQLEIVFSNLFKNAIEAMKDLPGEKERILTIGFSRNEKSLTISVKDTGHEVKTADQKRLFQSHFSTKGSEGAGMGLFLCRQIIQSHRGSIQYVANPSEGKMFLVSLPLQ